jgi:hypothetical protein
MIGVIDNINSISGTLSSNLSITGSLSSTNQLVGGLNLNGSVYADYSGDYEITPRVESQTLPTKNKVLRDNMEVKEIPYYETSNEYGNTIYIGSEVEVNGN